MLPLNKNIKGLILTIILAVSLLNIKDPYIKNNINQLHSTNEHEKIKPATQTNISKTENKIEEKQNGNIDESKKQIPSNKEPIEKQPSRGGSINNEIDITLTFYSSLGEENGGFTGINCSGKKLTPGTVANNVLPQGTEIYTEEFGTLTVADRGGNNFNTIHRLDVYLPREQGENDKDYFKRVNNMGRVKVKGYLVK